MATVRRVVVSISIFLVSFVAAVHSQTPSDSRSAAASTPAGQLAVRAANSNSLPLAFEPNEGQADPSVRFLAHAAGQLLLLKDGEAMLQLRGSAGQKSPSRFTIRFEDSASAAKIEGVNKQEGTSNYFIGNDASKWRTHVANYASVSYRQLYPGVDLRFYGNQGRLEYDFVVAPGADYRKIALDLQGGSPILEADGSLLVTSATDSVRFHAPRIYQQRDAQQVEVAGGFQLEGNRLTFRVGDHDRDLPLIIDPILTYSTYLAGSSSETGVDIAVDASGNAYVTGTTYSSDFPAVNAYQSTCNSCPNGSTVFITKVNPTGSSIVFSTYLGGSTFERPLSIAVDTAGNVTVGGMTQSADFPTKNPIVVPSGSGYQGFLASLTPDGSSLNFSTYLGGNYGNTGVYSVTTDASGNVYATGSTQAADFPVKPSTNVIGIPLGNSIQGVFVVKLSVSGALSYSTTIGPDPAKQLSSATFKPAPGRSIAVDSDGSAYFAGSAGPGFPVTPGVIQPAYPGTDPSCTSCLEGFITRLKPNGSELTFATYVGGATDSAVTGLVIDSKRSIYVTGVTSSTDFPTTPGSYLRSIPGSQSNPHPSAAFVAKLSSKATSLVYSTFLCGTLNCGSPNVVYSRAIAVDASGEAFVAGYTNDPTFPLKNPLLTVLPVGEANLSPGNSAFVTSLNATGSALLFSTLFSGSIDSQAASVALDPASSGKSVYIVGTTYDSDLPTTPSAVKPSVPPSPPDAAINHAFLTKFDLATPSPTVCTDQTSLIFSANVNTNAVPAIIKLTNCGGAPLTFSGFQFPAYLTQTNTCSQSLQPGKSCTLTVNCRPTLQGTFPETISISSDAPIQPLRIPVQVNGLIPSAQFSDSPLTLPDQLIGTTGPIGSLTVTNRGDGTLSLSSISISGDLADFSVDSSLCSTSVPYGPFAGCTIHITFHPTKVGLRSINVTLVDNALDSPQTTTVQANGVSSYPVPTLSSVTPDTALQNGADQTLTLIGSSFFTTSIVRVQGVPVPTSYGSGLYLFATIPVELLKNLGQLNLDVVNPAPGGGVSNSLPVLVYQRIPIAAKDLIFEPYTRRLYASIDANSSSNPNTIVSIDPEKEKIGSYIPIGNGPNKLTLSDDGNYLYVGLDGDHTVRQFNVTTGTLGSVVNLPFDSVSNATTTAWKMRVVPGRPEAIVVGLGGQTNSLGYGVSLISHGALTSTILATSPKGTSIDSICFLSDPRHFYGSNGGQLQRFSIINDALSVTSSITLPQKLGTNFGCDAQYLYGYLGLVYDPVAAQTIGTLPLLQYSSANSIQLDANAGRALYLTDSNPILQVFDQKTFAALGTLPAAPNSGAGSSLVRWGRDGLAYLISGTSPVGNYLILFRSSLAVPTSGTSPRPLVQYVSPVVHQNHANFQLTVTGSNFVPGSVVQWNGSNRTTLFQSSTTLIADIPASDVKNLGTAIITVYTWPQGGGTSNQIKYVINP